MSVVLPVPGLEPAAPARRFGFLGRVSTEENQDPEASCNWQKSRNRALIESAGGIIVAEYFDIGQSRSLPWKRRPRAAQLLADLADPGRGFDAVVIGEPQRAFYGNQYSLIMPVFAHYGVELWVPEVGGPIDPDSEAHDLIMSVFGGLSKGERNRIKLRVRAAMSAQAALEGRFLGGHPPHGYRLADAGPHPNPAKAADGKRLHKLEPDPATAWVIRRIFAEYLAGRGLFAIAEGLTRDGIPSPSQHDRARNQHRTGQGWSKSAVRTILASTATRLPTTGAATPANTPWASHVRHPANVYLREADLPPAVDRWLAAVFAPHRLGQTIRETQAAQERVTAVPALPAPDAQAVIGDCDARLVRYQAALDAGADPQAVAKWTRQVKAERAAALARDRRPPGFCQLTEDEIRALIAGLGDLRDVVRDAEPAVKAAIYQQMGLKVTYLPGEDKIRTEVTISPETFMQVGAPYGAMGRVRGGLGPRSWWYIPKRGIYHQSTLTREGPAGSAIRRRNEAAAPARLAGPDV